MIEPELGGRVLCPRAIWHDDSNYRLYYMEYGASCSLGVKGVVVSAISSDGENWTRESGVRLGPVCTRSEKRVLAPDIVRLPDGSGRMYAEGRNDYGSDVIISARSADGIDWIPESGLRIVDPTGKISFGTPHCVELSEGGWRMYCHALSSDAYHIISAYSDDGLSWLIEPGVRILQEKPEERYAVYSPFVGRTDNGVWFMLYSAWSSPTKGGCILSATSDDGINWNKCSSPVLLVGDRYDSRHCSEPCLLELSDGSWRLYYEACDAHGVWRILGAVGN